MSARVALFAWDGNPREGFYVVPEQDAEIFERRYGDDADHWVRMDNEKQPAHFLGKLPEIERSFPSETE